MKRRISCIGLLVCYACVARADDIEVVRAAWISRQQILNDVRVDYRYAIKHHPSEDELALNGATAGDATLVLVIEPSSGEGFWRRSDHKFTYGFAVDAVISPSLKAGFAEYIASNSGDRFERLMVAPDGFARGSIEATGSPAEGEYADVALGVRVLRAQSFLSGDDISAAAGEKVGSEHVEFSIHAPSGQVHRLTFRTSDFFLSQYSGYSPAGLRFVSATMKPGITFESLEMPVSADFVFYRQDGSVQKEVSYVVSNCRRDNSEFRITWPVDTHVLDSRSGANVLIQAPSKTLSDAKLADAEKWMKETVVAPKAVVTPISNWSTPKLSGLIALNVLAIITYCAVRLVQLRRSKGK